MRLGHKIICTINQLRHAYIQIVLFNTDLTFFGGDSKEETPVPIPNTEVKLFSADGTAREAEWESRTLPEIHLIPGIILHMVPGFLLVVVIRILVCYSGLGDIVNSCV